MTPKTHLIEAFLIRAVLALGEPTVPPPLAPAARAPPSFETQGAGKPELASNQSPPRDAATPAIESGFHFDQTVN